MRLPSVFDNAQQPILPPDTHHPIYALVVDPPDEQPIDTEMTDAQHDLPVALDNMEVEDMYMDEQPGFSVGGDPSDEVGQNGTRTSGAVGVGIEIEARIEDGTDYARDEEDEENLNEYEPDDRGSDDNSDSQSEPLHDNWLGFQPGMEEPTSEPENCIDLFPEAGSIVDRGEPCGFSRVLEEKKARGDNNLYFPFANKMEWELVAWLHQVGVSISEINQFLRLEYVCIVPNITSQKLMSISGPITATIL